MDITLLEERREPAVAFARTVGYLSVPVSTRTRQPGPRGPVPAQATDSLAMDPRLHELDHLRVDAALSPSRGGPACVIANGHRYRLRGGG